MSGRSIVPPAQPRGRLDSMDQALDPTTGTHLLSIMGAYRELTIGTHYRQQVSPGCRVECLVHRIQSTPRLGGRNYGSTAHLTDLNQSRPDPHSAMVRARATPRLAIGVRSVIANRTDTLGS